MKIKDLTEVKGEWPVCRAKTRVRQIRRSAKSSVIKISNILVQYFKNQNSCKDS